MPDRRIAGDTGAYQPCGCATREGHAEPTVDPVLLIEHGERDALNDDPLPHAVPGTGGWNGLYNASPDAYCLCGHPNYLDCRAWASGDNLGALTLTPAGAEADAHG